MAIHTRMPWGRSSGFKSSPAGKWLNRFTSEVDGVSGTRGSQQRGTPRNGPRSPEKPAPSKGTPDPAKGRGTHYPKPRRKPM